MDTDILERLRQSADRSLELFGKINNLEKEVVNFIEDVSKQNFGTPVELLPIVMACQNFHIKVHEALGDVRRKTQQDIRERVKEVGDPKLMELAREAGVFDDDEEDDGLSDDEMRQINPTAKA